MDDEDLAGLAAEWARMTRSALARAYLLIVLPLSAAAVLGGVWAASRSEPDGFSLSEAFVIGGVTLTLLTILAWAVGWRPYVRAERANRARAGLGPPPAEREPGHWVLAVVISWWPAMVVGVLLQAAGIKLHGAVGFVLWAGMTFATKRILDSTLR